MPFTIVQGRDVGEVRLYTMSTCAWCDRMKRLLDDNGVKYSYLDMDRADEAERRSHTAFLDSIYPGWGFPCLLFEEKVLIVGYQQEEIIATLGLTESGGVKNASDVEIPLDEEAKKTRERLQRFSQKRGASLNPDRSITARLINGILQNQKRYGYWACPCRLAEGDRKRDRDIICPCHYWEQDVAEFGACYCGLFVSQQVMAGEIAVSKVPERRNKRSV